MKLVDVDSFSRSHKTCRWLQFKKGIFSPILLSNTFGCTYSVHAVAAAGLTEGFLKLFFDDQITSGSLWVQLIIPYESGPIEVFDFMIKAAEGDPFSLGKTVIMFEKEYDNLLSVMTWCFACDWRFQFISADARFVVSNIGNRNATVSWDINEIMSSNALAIIKSWDFTPIPSNLGAS